MKIGEMIRQFRFLIFIKRSSREKREIEEEIYKIKK